MTPYRLEVLNGFAHGEYAMAPRGMGVPAAQWLHEHGYIAEHGVQRGFYKLTWLGRNALEAGVTATT